MKALSYIVASILMLIITVALSGTAYLYMSGILTGSIQGIEIADAYCSLGEVTLSIRNIGTSTITSLEIEQTNPKDDFLAPSFKEVIEPGKAIQYKDTCEGEQPRKCIYRITPPVGKTITSEATCTSKPESLVLSLHFDEESGTAAKDSSGRNNNGVFNGETFNDGASYSGASPTDLHTNFGKYGKALQFDGIDDYVSIASQTGLDFTDAFSIEGWIYHNVDTLTQITVFSTAKFLLGGFEVYKYDQDGLMVAFYYLGGTWTSYTAANLIPKNGWYHIAVTYDKSLASGNVKMFINGNEVAVTEANHAEGIGSNINTPLIGKSYVANNNWNGIIDELRIFNRTLTQSEIQAEMQSSIPIARAVASYSFEETGQYVNDTHIWVQGKYGNALSFDGINDYVRINDSTSLHPTEITVEAWINSRSFGNYDGIVTKYDRSGGKTDSSFSIQVYPAAPYGRIVLRVDNASEDYHVTDPYYYKSAWPQSALSENQWYHIAGTYDGVHLRLYVNGVEAANCDSGGLGECREVISGTVVPRETITGPLNPTNGSIHIGVDHPEYMNMFNGIIDEVRIYNEALI